MALFKPPRAALCADEGAVIARRLRIPRHPTRFPHKKGSALKQRKRHLPRSCLRRLDIQRKALEACIEAVRRRSSSRPGRALCDPARFRDCAAPFNVNASGALSLLFPRKKTPAQGGRRARAIGRPRRRNHGFETGFAFAAARRIILPRRRPIRHSPLSPRDSYPPRSWNWTGARIAG